MKSSSTYSTNRSRKSASASRPSKRRCSSTSSTKRVVEPKPEKHITWNYILKLEKERIKVNGLVHERRNIYIKSAFKVILMLRKDMFRIYHEVTDNFYWRNFSKYVSCVDWRASSR